ncbi:hypothetical protein ANCDUO_04990 [Ancylostoma duodenale]|uniref:Paired domain-containing protein n=1 Tax=Ancylostoma duodenale TaxID=51022 RepID=A0A0C2GZP3_9BILA|nr:hypothetical protein ANCDUO_04990 [Ancylostoma duodenale]
MTEAGWKICDISKRLCVTHSCVSKILNRYDVEWRVSQANAIYDGCQKPTLFRYRQTGSVRPKDAKEGRTESPLVTAVRDYRCDFSSEI